MYGELCIVVHILQAGGGLSVFQFIMEVQIGAVGIIHIFICSAVKWQGWILWGVIL